MADNRNYTITLKIDGTTDINSNSAVAGSSTQSTSSAVGHGANKPGLLQSPEARANYTSALVAWHTIKPFVTQHATYQTSLVALRTGSNEMQEKANLINQTVQTGVGLLEMAATGAAIGGGAGAVIGAISSVASSIFGLYQRTNKLSLERTIENKSLEMLRIRAGTLGSRSNYQ